MSFRVRRHADETARLVSLVHRLQRERGATAAFVAGSVFLGKTLRPCGCGTGSLVADLRRRTDRVVTDDILSELSGLRSAADVSFAGGGESARLCFSMLSGYSELIKSISTRAFVNLPSVILLVATLKELYAQQRGFLVGVGGLPAASVVALPPRAFAFILRVHEDLDTAQRRLTTCQLPPPVRTQLLAAIKMDDERMVELVEWLRSDALDMPVAALRHRLEHGAMSTEDCWTSWTSHCDKLQSFEDVLLTQHYEAAAARAKLRALARNVAAAVGVLLVAVALYAGLLLLVGTTISITISIGSVGAIAYFMAPRLRDEWATVLGAPPAVGGVGLAVPPARGDAGALDLPSSCSPSGTSPSSGPSPIIGSPAASLDAIAAPTAAGSGLRRADLIARAVERSLSWVRGRSSESEGGGERLASRPRLAQGMQMRHNLIIAKAPPAGGHAEPYAPPTVRQAAPAPADAQPAGLQRVGDSKRDLLAMVASSSDEGGNGTSDPQSLSDASGIFKLSIDDVPKPKTPAKRRPPSPARPPQPQGHVSAIESSMEMRIRNQAGADDAPPQPQHIPVSTGGEARHTGKIGLVAHKPMSAVLARSETESLANVLDAAMAPPPPTSASSRHRLPPPVLADVGRTRDSSKTSSGDSRTATPSKLAGSATSSGARSPRATQFDPGIDLLLDLFDNPKCLDDFAEVRCLGRGSFGQALLMRSPTGQQLVAKRLQLQGTSPAELRRLETEVAVCAKLRHPNICHYLGTVSRGEDLLICLEYAAGGTLAHRIDTAHEARTLFPYDVAVSWIAQVRAFSRDRLLVFVPRPFP